MKFKSVYIYLGLLLAVILILVIFTNNSDSINDKAATTSGNMPDDDIHKDLNPPAGNPSMGNVSGSAKKQLELLKKSYEENPNDTAGVKEYADMLNAAHQPQKALELYETILKIDPNRIDILLGSTFSFYNLNNLDKAEEYTKRILSIDSKNEEANFNLGAIAAAKGDKIKAREHWNYVIKQFPNSQAAKIAESSLKKL